MITTINIRSVRNPVAIERWENEGGRVIAAPRAEARARDRRLTAALAAADHHNVTIIDIRPRDPYRGPLLEG